MTPYDEGQVVAYAADVRGAYAQAGQAHDPLDDAAAVWVGRMQFDAVTIGYASSRAKHLAELQQALGIIPPVPPLPPVPSRDQVCSATTGFQGLTATTKQYGTFPMFGPETTTLADDDLVAYCQQIRAQGFRAGEIDVSWQYDEPGFLMPVPGRDLSDDLPELVRRVTLMLRYLDTVKVALAGDGRSKPKGSDGRYPYNDPVGHTYGYEWLMDNLARILAAFQGSPDGDLTQRVIFTPGYDGVFYGWGEDTDGVDRQPARVKAFVHLFRQLCPHGYLLLEHIPGKIPTGDGASDWVTGGDLDGVDIVASEFSQTPCTGGEVWQIVGRCVPHYTQPPEQLAARANPADPNHAAAMDADPPPHYLAPPTTRGPRFYWAYEYATYQWTRGRISAADVEVQRQRFRAMGVEHVA